MGEEWVMGIVFVLVGVAYFFFKRLVTRIGEDE